MSAQLPMRSFDVPESVCFTKDEILTLYGHTLPATAELKAGFGDMDCVPGMLRRIGKPMKLGDFINKVIWGNLECRQYGKRVMDALNSNPGKSFTLGRLIHDTGIKKTPLLITLKEMEQEGSIKSRVINGLSSETTPFTVWRVEG
jgi:hypothetical protein